MIGEQTIAVVIPCYMVKRKILTVLSNIGTDVDLIYVVDDACPEASGDILERECKDDRVRVIRHLTNAGVGAAVMTGYARAIEEGADVIVKIDGDNQMDPALLPHFVRPIVDGVADYTKGNRFYDLDKISRMPAVRIIGNAMLSFLSKLSTGYWGMFDPTNGYTAIHARVAERLPFDKISKRFFFETDMLFRLNTLRARVQDIPMDPVYDDEISNLRVSSILPEFLVKNVGRLGKRIFYNYFLRDFSVASVELVLGICLFGFGFVFGIYNWNYHTTAGSSAPVGTVMLAALPILTGTQLLLAFLSYDIASVPKQPIHNMLGEYSGNKSLHESAENIELDN